MTKEKLPIHKQYLVISAPVPFRLIANNGTDIVERPAGVWQLDCYKLLPEKFMKNYPVFNLELEYDESKIEYGFTFEYYFTNINLGDSLKGVSGDLIELSDSQFSSILSNLGDIKESVSKLNPRIRTSGEIRSSTTQTIEIKSLFRLCFFLFEPAVKESEVGHKAFLENVYIDRIELSSELIDTVFLEYDESLTVYYYKQDSTNIESLSFTGRRFGSQDKHSIYLFDLLL